MARLPAQNPQRPADGPEGGAEKKRAGGKRQTPAVPADFIENLYTLYWKDLCNWLRWRYGAGPPDPEDVAQSAFVKMATLEDCQRIENPRAFLFTVAANTALMGIRWLARTQRFIDDELQAEGEKLEEMSPERIYSSRERLDVVTRQLERLSAKQRDIVMRSRIGGQTYEQISAETGWSLADISRQLTAAMAAMRRALEVYDDEDKDGAVEN